MTHIQTHYAARAEARRKMHRRYRAAVIFLVCGTFFTVLLSAMRMPSPWLLAGMLALLIAAIEVKEG